MATTQDESGKETFTVKPALPPPTSVPTQPRPPSVEVQELEDDLSASVPAGTVCKRNGCGKEYVSDEVSRLGDGVEATCTYHPKSVSTVIWRDSTRLTYEIFSSQSFTKAARCVISHALAVDEAHKPQGYLCCKRRVLEFDEFLKIGGCKQGRHLFVPKDQPTQVSTYIPIAQSRFTSHILHQLDRTIHGVPHRSLSNTHRGPRFSVCEEE